MSGPRGAHGSHQRKKTPAAGQNGESTEADVPLVVHNPYMTLGPELVQSRSLLLRVLRLLHEQSEALTVLGAHAVFEQTKHIVELPGMDSTHDADVGVAPELLLPKPLLDHVMDSAGLEPASQSRPGVWGLKSEHGKPLHERLTIDLIAPASVAGTGRRSATVGPHGRRSVSKTNGTELSLIDRQWLTIESFDNNQPSRGCYVAGVAALICAKVYKIHDRLEPTEFARNPKRFKTKDVVDLFRLFLTKNGAEVRRVFDQGLSDARLTEAISEGVSRLLKLRDREDGNWVTDQILDQWGEDVMSRDQIRGVIEDWFADFGS